MPTPPIPADLALLWVSSRVAIAAVDVASAVPYSGLLVGLSAGLATFVASVMADEQSQRLRNGTFGAIAGSAVGALGALVTNEKSLLFLGVLGSSLGATVGWGTSVLLSLWAAKSTTGRTVLEYQIGGWTAVRQRLDIEANEPLFAALREWGRDYARRVGRQKEAIVRLPRGPDANRVIALMLRAWLASFTDMLDLLFKLAKRPNYRSRVTVIVFGRDEQGHVVGKHWIADSGELAEHKTGRHFDDQSIGYKVLTNAPGFDSPYFTTTTVAKAEGQDRGDPEYRPFLTFQLDGSAILAIDWPIDLAVNDPYIVHTRELFQKDLCPAIRGLFGHWSGPLADDIGLRPLAAPAVPPAGATGATAAAPAADQARTATPRLDAGATLGPNEAGEGGD